ncbi:MAG: hypothetical protein AAFU54_14730 [Chloroflexota bacterium]
MQTSRRTYILVVLVTVVSILHHTDHVLRVDHSGWPFTPDVNPFTVSVILAYSISAFVLFVRGRLWAKFWLLLAGYIATQTAHIFIETPMAQYTTWALNASQDPETFGQPNLLGIAAPLLGWIAVTISILLSVVLVLATVSAFVDARLATREQPQPHQDMA